MDEFPKVIFRTEDVSEIRYGYLAIIDGIPWLAQNEEDARARVFPLMIRLDPAQLEADDDTPEGNLFYRYRGVLRGRP